MKASWQRNVPGMHPQTPETGSQPNNSGELASTMDGEPVSRLRRNVPRKFAAKTKHQTPNLNFLATYTPNPGYENVNPVFRRAGVQGCFT